MNRLAKKIAIVTGAAGGIGRGIALAFAREGADVAVCDQLKAPLTETAQLIEKTGRRAYHAVFDLRSEGSIKAFVESVEERLGPVSVLVNNAAVMPVALVEETTETQFDDCVSVKLKSAVFASKYCVPSMRKAGGGSIIHMASVTGNVGFARHAVYGAVNAAVIGLARGMAMELARHNIRVNSVSPGTVDSPMLHSYIQRGGRNPEELRLEFDRIHPRGCIGSIEEVAAVFVFLASDESANITATDIRCDGGYSFKGGQADG
ncbi:MAG: SDR family oxidoreductase [Verrucomicrobia bacterium]|nr:SDR family oxidoreductase [Verrucomicrobiota bacterium]